MLEDARAQTVEAEAQAAEGRRQAADQAAQRRAQAEEGAEGARHEDHHHVLWRLGLSIIASPCEFPTATHVFATSSVGQKAKANFCSGLA